MSSNYFGANKSGTGGAAFITVNVADESIWVKFAKQTGWNDETKKGSFKDGESLNFKLSLDEAADVVRAVRSKGSVKFYHSSGDSATTGQFSYYSIPDKDKEGNQKKDAAGKLMVREGYSWKVNRGDLEIKVGLSPGGAMRTALTIEHMLGLIIQADIEKEAIRFQEFQNNKKNSSKSQSNNESSGEVDQESTPPKKNTPSSTKPKQQTPKPAPKAESEPEPQEENPIEEGDEPF